MNIGSYHKQQQQLLQFNIHQQHPSIISSNENDLRTNVSANNVQNHPNEMNMIPSPDNVAADQLSQYASRMSVNDAQTAHSQFPPNVPDFNRNVQNNENVYFAQHQQYTAMSQASLPKMQSPSSTYPDQMNTVGPVIQTNQVNTINVSSGGGIMNHSTRSMYSANDSSRISHVNGTISSPVSSPMSPPISQPLTSNAFRGAHSMYPPQPQSQMYTQNNSMAPPLAPPQFNQNPSFAHVQPRQQPRYDNTKLENNYNGQANVMPPPPGGPVYNTQYSQPYQQQQAQRRLDPDQMPSPIQVMQEDQETRGNVSFVTNQAGLVPPFVTTNFMVEDEGNANPRYIRSTMYSVPCNVDIMKQADVPFSLIITPLATLPYDEQLPPVVDTGDLGPVRCVRCKAYVNPYMKFIDGGRRFVCILCKAVTEVPTEYFQHLDHTGHRVDRYERAELRFGSYEFTVTKDYCKDNELPNVPAFIFIIDVSYNNMKSGVVQLLCEEMADIIQNYMPKDDNAVEGKIHMRVGFITYDSTLHFYNVKGCLGQPQMMIVSDVEDVFVPLLDGFLCDPMESLPVIKTLMQQIPASFVNTRETDTLMLPAVQAGLEALKAAKCAGKLFVFHSSLPTANAPGKLVNREDRKLLSTDKEKILLNPQNSAYTTLAQDCVSVGCSVDLFVFNNSHVDLATIGQICKITGGEIYKYTYFQAEIDGDRFIKDVKRNIEREIAFDAVMRVRTSTGVRPVNFYGNLHMTTTTDVELASINADKSIAVEIKHDDKLTEEDGVFVQVALLYTSCFGQRRVRILNLALKCCLQMADLFRNCELDTLLNFLSKSAVTKLLEATPRQVKEGLLTKCSRILACYRKFCANPSSPGQLILPECMKLLPLYVNCLLKNDAISGGSDMTVDDRSYMMSTVLILDIVSSVNYFYPRLIPLVNISYEDDEIPFSIRCTSLKMSNDEAYLLENGIYMFLWLGSQLPNEWMINVFGVADISLVNVSASKIPIFDNVHSRKLNSLIERIQNERRHTMKLTIVRENDKMEIVFKHFLVEDGSGSGIIGDNFSSCSYVDFLCQMHKEIRNILS